MGPAPSAADLAGRPQQASLADPGPAVGGGRGRARFPPGAGDAVARGAARPPAGATAFPGRGAAGEGATAAFVGGRFLDGPPARSTGAEATGGGPGAAPGAGSGARASSAGASGLPGARVVAGVRSAAPRWKGSFPRTRLLPIARQLLTEAAASRAPKRGRNPSMVRARVPSATQE